MPSYDKMNTPQLKVSSEIVAEFVNLFVTPKENRQNYDKIGFQFQIKKIRANVCITGKLVLEFNFEITGISKMMRVKN